MNNQDKQPGGTLDQILWLESCWHTFEYFISQSFMLWLQSQRGLLYAQLQRDKTEYAMKNFIAFDKEHTLKGGWSDERL